MVVTDQRVLFLWRRWLCGMSLMSMEESFYLDDLQVVTVPFFSGTAAASCCLWLVHPPTLQRHVLCHIKCTGRWCQVQAPGS